MNVFNPIPKSILDWMEATPLNRFMLDYAWSWVAVEIVHFTGMCLLFGSVTIMDLRLVGVARRIFPITASHTLVPLALCGFVMNLVTGILFLFGHPYRYAVNVSFQIKVILLLLAGINVAYFWRRAVRDLESVGAHDSLSVRLRLIGASSLILWLGVIVFGRMIPYMGTG